LSLPSFQERQRSHFDTRAEAYRGLYGRETPFHARTTGRFLEFAGVRPGERVLDLGCGHGRLTLPLLARGCQVTGLDLSGPTLDALRDRTARLGLAARFEPRCAAVEALDDRLAYDRILGRGLLHHLEAPAVVLPRIHGALRPGGSAAFMDPNPLQPAWLAFVLLHPLLSWRIERHVWRHTPSGHARLLREAGFMDSTVEFVGFLPPLPARLAAELERVARVLESAPGARALSLYQMIRGTRV
jgi:2-polyprenyl-3-methyl-5-hydroxy-6-metoxy-1,4-benzoquinol methylase